MNLQFLVVESAGFNDQTWLDSAGHPHTQTRFAGFYDWSITFLRNDKGETPDLLEMHISGNYRYSKTK